MQASACFAIELAISPPSLPANSWPQWHRHYLEQSTGPPNGTVTAIPGSSY